MILLVAYPHVHRDQINACLEYAAALISNEESLKV